MKSSYTEISLRLENIVVTDLNPRTIHTKILSIIGDNALNVQFVMFNLEETSEYNSDNMKIDITMGCAKIIFMNWFVTSVLNFLDHFQTAQDRIKEASKAAAEAAKQNVVAAYEQATRIKMNIKIKAPIILVPVHSRSLEAIVVDLGNLKITNLINNLDVKSDHGPAVIDEMKVELSDVKLSKVRLHGNDDFNESSDTTVSSRFTSTGKKLITPKTAFYSNNFHRTCIRNRSKGLRLKTNKLRTDHQTKPLVWLVQGSSANRDIGTTSLNRAQRHSARLQSHHADSRTQHDRGSKRVQKATEASRHHNTNGTQQR